jgi:hypothetical protein
LIAVSTVPTTLTQRRIVFPVSVISSMPSTDRGMGGLTIGSKSHEISISGCVQYSRRERLDDKGYD